MFLVRNPDVPSTEMKGEHVVMDLVSGKYFSLQGTAGVIWQLLSSPHTEAELVTKLAQQYQLDEANCYHDTHPFLEQLLAKGLIVQRD
ncbi:PqqD family protein [Tolumonas lignilytica]|uniref:PqqD family protein n=1 Tax=Tolumonas lignilytica TaxID=1283284 RepID=UPI0004B607BE|nr:PqqD family protein [Tolumonas lignilytica]